MHFGVCEGVLERGGGDRPNQLSDRFVTLKGDYILDGGVEQKRWDASLLDNER